MDFQIEKNVPVPPGVNSKHHELKRVCAAMEPGDSLLLDNKTGHMAAGFIRKIFDEHVGGRRTQRKAVTRKEGLGRRVWRLPND